VWVVRPVSKGGASLGGRQAFEVLLQKRSAAKESYPGCYDISAAGHLPAGSGYLESALRELEEELGIQAEPQDLKEAFLHLGYAESTFYGRPFRNAEISAVYVYTKPIEIESLRLQKEEVESVRWMEYEALLSEVRRETEAGNTEKYCIFLDELEKLGEWMLSAPAFAGSVKG